MKPLNSGRLINFDNSATSFPKPENVRRAVGIAMAKYGGNPGRSGHSLSVATAGQVFRVRKVCGEFFGAQPENVAFTPNCTYALNMAIKGMAQYGGHIIISGYEHNACARPVYALAKTRGVSCSMAKIYDDDSRTVEEFKRLIRRDTVCVCCIIASNVTGRILPYKEIAELCRRKGICFIADGAQACGVLDLKMSDGFNFLCTAGHKALYGPSGTGLLISDGQYSLSTIIEGGTGATSAELAQTPFLPEKMESGSINTAGIIGLGAGLDFVRTKTVGRIFSYEKELCRLFESGLDGIDGIKIYDREFPRAPITAFNIGGRNSQEVAGLLSEKGFGLRGGLQCAAVAHSTLGTLEQGIVRFSPSAFNTPQQVKALVGAVREISKTPELADGDTPKLADSDTLN